MRQALLLSLLVLIPILSGILSRFFKNPWIAMSVSIGGIFLASILGLIAIGWTLFVGRIFAFYDWLLLDYLSAYHLAVLLLVFCLGSIFSWIYFGEEIREKKLSLTQIRTFAGFWGPSLSAMILVLISNNLGIMWVAMEATTLLTSILIIIHFSRESIEAMWRYMLICSVGIGFAFMGTLMIRMAAKDLPLDPNQSLLWTNLILNTSSLNAPLVKAAFIFILVGYGTKVGLGPMHNWLPDAHSKAPAPVSAVFSGFMLNAALYCILRYLPIVDGVMQGNRWAFHLLTGFGLFSIIIASAFILFQQDIKRLLAYSSIEHLGIIAVGIGLGNVGTFAALFHMLNHSLCKSLAFFSVGRLGQIFGSHNMDKMAGSFQVSPIWSLGFLGSIFALMGVAPFSIFMSKFLILKSAVNGNHMIVVSLFLAGTALVFVGLLKHILPLLWGKTYKITAHFPAKKLETVFVIIPLVFILLLGIWMPQPFQNVLDKAAIIIQGTPE